MLKKVLSLMLIGTLIISGLCIFSGCGKKEEKKDEVGKEEYEAPLRSYMDGLTTKNIEKVLAAYPEFMRTVTQADLDAIYAKYESTYGANLKMEYTLSDGIKLAEQKDLDTLASQIKEYYPDAGDINVTAAYIITVNLTISGEASGEGNAEGENAEANKKTESQDFYVYKFNDAWYVF